MEQDGLVLLNADGIVVWHRKSAPADGARTDFAVIPDQQGQQNGCSL